MNRSESSNSAEGTGSGMFPILPFAANQGMTLENYPAASEQRISCFETASSIKPKSHNAADAEMKKGELNRSHQVARVANLLYRGVLIGRRGNLSSFETIVDQLKNRDVG